MSSDPFKLEVHCSECNTVNELVATEISFAEGVKATCSSCGAVLPDWKKCVRQAIARDSDGWSFGRSAD